MPPTGPDVAIRSPAAATPASVRAGEAWGIATLILGALLACQAGAAAPAKLEQHPGLSQRPAVAVPACRAPRPYLVEHWTATANRFYVSLARNMAWEEAGREARQLAARHGFQIDGSVAIRSGGGYFFAVSWLEPRQVAALRCERTVDEIDVLEEVQVTSGGRY